MVQRLRQRRNNKNQISNVRVVDDDAGGDSAYVNRCITQMQNSHSQVTLICSDTFTLSTGAAASGLVAGSYTGSGVRAMDEFVSIAAQFDTYRIRAIRFDVYDINQSIAATNVYSTFHDVAPSGTSFAPPPLATTVDGPDSKNVAPGTGREHFYWVARGTNEQLFQATDASGAADFGGLRWGFFSPTLSTAKYQVVVKAIVDFRGRA